MSKEKGHIPVKRSRPDEARSMRIDQATSDKDLNCQTLDSPRRGFLAVSQEGQHQQQMLQPAADIIYDSAVFNPYPFGHAFQPSSPFTAGVRNTAMLHNPHYPAFSVLGFPPSTVPMIWCEGLYSMPPPNQAVLSTAFMMGAAWVTASAQGNPLGAIMTPAVAHR
jgi:hypothetical protein